jgi:hypothetical protein
MRVKEKNRPPRIYHKNITERFEQSFKSGFFIDLKGKISVIAWRDY